MEGFAETVTYCIIFNLHGVTTNHAMIRPAKVDLQCIVIPPA